MCIPTIRELPYMTDFLKIAKSMVVHFAHICAYGVETVKLHKKTILQQTPSSNHEPLAHLLNKGTASIFFRCTST